MKIRLVTVLLLFLCLVGCKAMRFQYPNSACQVRRFPAAKQVAIAVDEIVDLRDDKSSTEGWSMLCNLPLVPCVPYHNYDLQGYNADVGSFAFNVKRELREALVRHVNESGIGVACQDSNKACDYRIVSRLHKIGIDGYRTFYCLGLFPGCFAAILGAPFNYATSSLEIEFELLDRQGKVVLSKRYGASRDYVVGEYINWNCLKYVGMNLCEIMNQFCQDASVAMRKEQRQ